MPPTRTNRATRAGRVVLAALVVCLLTSTVAGAQTAKERYQATLARDKPLRAAIERAETTSTPSPGLMTEARRVTASYETLVRRYPTSGYADNALWQAGTLADAVFQAVQTSENSDRAVRFYRWLVMEYPGSSLVKDATKRLARLAEPRAEPSTEPRVANVASVVPAGHARATLMSIQRAVLPDTVRITLELDREVAYHEEKIGGPARLFFDLQAVQLTPALQDKVLTYAGDIVHQIRVGRHPGNKVRVVLDLEDVSRYSVFTLYSPFRLVIDCERATAPSTAAPGTPALGTPAPSTPAPSTPAPTTPAPSTVAPSTPAPGTTAPTPALGTPAPSTPILSTMAPSTMAPSVAPPSTNGAGGFSMARQLGLGVSRIVIDPGHGGHDPGAMAKGLNEADLVLDVALRLEALLKKEPGLEVALTRRTNVYIPLEERTAIANRQGADLFLSIHANASRNAAARGIETYFLSFASSPDAEAVAARENSASEREMHHLPDMIKAIALNNKLDESRDLASMVQESLVTRLRKNNKDVRNLGVKKAPFVVLIGAAMPSVLAEIAFITNKQELQLVKTSNYKQRIAESLQAAILKYRRSLKGQSTVALQ